MDSLRNENWISPLPSQPQTTSKLSFESICLASPCVLTYANRCENVPKYRTSFFPLKKNDLREKYTQIRDYSVPIRDFSLRLLQCAYFAFSFTRFPVRFIEFTQLSPTRHHVRVHSRYNFNLHCKHSNKIKDDTGYS